jgi:hypothetical protein
MTSKIPDELSDAMLADAHSRHEGAFSVQWNYDSSGLVWLIIQGVDLEQRMSVSDGTRWWRVTDNVAAAADLATVPPFSFELVIA